MESAVVLCERPEGDAELQERLEELNTKECIAQCAKREPWYEFTPEELRNALFDRTLWLSEEEPEAIVGGSVDEVLEWIGVAVGDPGTCVEGSRFSSRSPVPPRGILGRRKTLLVSAASEGTRHDSRRLV